MAKVSALAKRSTATRSTGSKKAKSAKHDEHFYTIGDLSREFGVTLRTLRFYEDLHKNAKFEALRQTRGINPQLCRNAHRVLLISLFWTPSSGWRWNALPMQTLLPLYYSLQTPPQIQL